MILEELEDAHKFKLWKSNLIANGLKINKIDEHFTRRRYNGEVLFSLLMLDAETPEGDKIPPICFLKGEVVCVLICLISGLTQRRHMSRQVLLLNPFELVIVILMRDEVAARW